jgi:hypothetical protein
MARAGDGYTACSRPKMKIEMPKRIITDVPQRRTR